ncbi:MAG: Glu-tRNA(Gln) amidotransferase subunit GatE [Halobacteriaceae archaeon]
MSAEFDYDALGLVAGLEIHQQLDTETKLFCECPTERREPEDHRRTITRYLHPTRSELGELDEAALAESRVDREFEYLVYDSTCLVEADEEPPGELDSEALHVALRIATLLDLTVVDSIQIMRKVVIDGSNTAGFQRTALIGSDGKIETEHGAVGIEDMMLEEESAARLTETEAGVRYGLDRLGIPLVEIGTAPDIETPAQAQAAAERIGMLLRSTGEVKRGLGTIRQDVNVSIADGARVELKGVQSLEDIDEIVRREVRRQVELLDIADTLQERGADVGDPIEVTEVFSDTDSDVIRRALDDGGAVWAARLAGFAGLLGRTIQADRRLGTELADHARQQGAGGLFHTDELPTAGVTDAEVTALREAVDARAEDGVILVADEPATAQRATDAAVERARVALEGVPEETRDAREDGTSRYLRPLPGAARMYPETDVPPVIPDPDAVEAPELLTERAARYESSLGLDSALAEQVAYSERMPLFEEAIETGVDPQLAARTLESTFVDLRRDGVPVGDLDTVEWRSLFEVIAAGEIAQEGVPELLREVAETGADVRTAMEQAGLGSADEAAVREVVSAVVERNADQVEAEGMGAFSALMGEAMGELRGKADGDLVSAVLREEIQSQAASEG